MKEEMFIFAKTKTLKTIFVGISVILWIYQ